MCDVTAYSANNVFKVCCAATTQNVPYISNICCLGMVPFRNTKIVPGKVISRKGKMLRRNMGSAGRELLVLRFRRQAIMRLGVIDDLAEQLLAQRSQRSLP